MAIECLNRIYIISSNNIRKTIKNLKCPRCFDNKYVPIYSNKIVLARNDALRYYFCLRCSYKSNATLEKIPEGELNIEFISAFNVFYNEWQLEKERFRLFWKNFI